MGKAIDDTVSSALVPAFRCSRTGMYFPGDYIEQWGVKYGHGMGPVPVSECLVNSYQSPIAEPRSGGKAMHPVEICRAQVDFVMITQEEFDSHRAILHIDDEEYNVRGGLMRDKQILKSAAMRERHPLEYAELLKKSKS